MDSRSIQDMHIYGDPSCIPVLRIEQHVMVVPQHGSSNDFEADASEPLDNILPPPQQREECTARKPGGVTKSGYILRAVIFVHGFQVGFCSASKWLFFLIGNRQLAYSVEDFFFFFFLILIIQKTGKSFGSTPCEKPVAHA
jgi:hypothetical protein